MYCYIEDYGNQKFYLDDGSVYCDNFNETLDSFSFNLSNFETTTLYFKKYQYFRVCSEDGNFDKYFVLDNFTTQIVNLNGIPKVNYRINLMSETKLLEKWLIPNRQILHSLVNESKTIGSVIREICELYIPKVKKVVPSGEQDTWDYSYYINYSPLRDYMHKNQTPFVLRDTKCPDLQFTKTSLREVLTALGQVVGYIPVVENRQLYWLNLRETATEFTYSGRILNVERSNSSDSFTTTLRSPLTNVLDNNNVVRNEVIGFRDAENVFLKQQENLTLTTDFPIEKVNKLTVSPIATLIYKALPPQPTLTYNVQLDGTETSIIFNGGMPFDTQYTTTIEFYMCDSPFIPLAHDGGGNHQQYVSGKPKFVQSVSVPLNATSFDLTPYLGTFTFFLIRGSADGQNEVVRNSLMCANYTTYIRYFAQLTPIDLTPIVFEKDKRQALSVDYKNIPSPNGTDLSPLAESYYTTLEYTYKKNTIYGFSNHWDWFEWYGKDEDTFIDVINSFIPNNYDDTLVNNTNTRFLTEIKDVYLLSDTHIAGITTPLQSSNRDLYADYINSDIVKYACVIFNIEYVPFNDITIDTPKLEDLPIEYYNFDTQESSIIMLDEFSARELDKVKRLGNNVLQIQQLMTTNFNEIQPLNSLYEVNKVIFSRQIEFHEYKNEDDEIQSWFNVSYVATANYVLKNFFTALQNKYRAYEYVDTNKSVLRQEIKKSYVRVDFDSLRNGSDIFGSKDYWFIVSSLMKNYEPLKYAIVGETNNYDQITTSYKYDLSIVATNNSIVVSHIEPYPNHYGIEIKEAKNESQELEDLGGYIQKWIDHSSTYKESHRLGYSSNSVLYDADGFYNVKETTQAPKIELSASLYEDNFAFYLTKVDTWVRKYNIDYYSNVGERLSNCSEFVYYTTNDNITLCNALTQYNRLGVNKNYDVVIVGRDNTNIYNDFATRVDTIVVSASSMLFNTYDGGVEVIWQGGSVSGLAQYDYAVICLHDTNTDTICDLIRVNSSAFSGVLSLCFSLNDTKTLRVYKPNATSNLWELSESCKLDSDTRNINS